MDEVFSTKYEELLRAHQRDINCIIDEVDF